MHAPYNIYERQSRWKIYLALAGLLIVGLSLFYTQFLAKRLIAEEQSKVQVLAQAYRSLSMAGNPNMAVDVELVSQIIQANRSIPVILVNDAGIVEAAQNYGEARDTNYLFLEQRLEAIKAQGRRPIVVDYLVGKMYIYYEHSRLLKWLQYYPIFQVVLFSIYIGFGYWAFSTSRRSEQNQVWVGMAKETAHQLGTPISSIVGWVELIQGLGNSDPELEDISNELRKDVMRLENIAERFSKIGSLPEKARVDLLLALRRNFDYMQRRAPRRVAFLLPEELEEGQFFAELNPALFDWVLENLLRNALDALDNQGSISADVYDDKDFVYIDISDTGKGIPDKLHGRIFRPGFTTKARGWGLGLSLCRRIIENYHSGRIFVKKSAPGEGTTFCIQLPK